ncbi:putative lipoprotein [Hyphomonas neptunium ATCC 15444]|uniref:Putative lipoprotein n=2 Tax=Hyphomonas TaxID=85 RepID=Q0BYQ6_HYPNA|nr:MULTISPECIES: TlpA disulfide reductase family protein [Hyphomonas]ABI78037.1 putative lipoprotein [Hyphomonas neptunium ATCC 15444]KCZ91513.1 putative lipoprotein [Hyphomonas hirschiana VP5]
MKRFPLILAAALMLSACGPAPSTESAPAAASAPAEETDTGPKAQGFITQNTAPPTGAADTKGDGVYRDSYGRPFQYALLGQKLPEFTAPTSDGGTFSSASINRWTVIDVWGAWCADCVADGPYVDALARAIAQDPDLDFVSIHVPANANRATPEELYGKYGSLEAYFASAGYTIPSVVLDTDASLRSLLQISWTPSYLLVSPDRVVRGFRTDLRVIEDQPVKTFIQDIAEVRKDVRDLLSSEPSDID